ncbi:ABC transporter permease [Sulfuricurvum sp.]|uniref:ABC transporter permease n=1 Tax=Sulfuricurvum sp. TaxID=2025608 RepID=UPI00262A042A|nr:ABC transporter permease [Sulfuricurvum sp.]MDD2367829.1 ABC transporter permease [Sulfuricurvum sp.]MDD2950991.1 ABC transporter permease [Sulfuricurvum sp.]MDD3598345.1 ABC transporter permease [Sulfuricurvum sp.]MDD4950313.1 ABC transporter permease [Sulfuricurvum sp.]
MINLAQRDISHSLGKFITTALGVGMLIGVMLIMLGVYRGMVHDAMIIPNDLKGDLWVVQKDTLGPFAESSRLHEDLKYALSGFTGVEKVYPLTFQSLQIIQNKKPIRVYALGYESLSGFTPFRLVEGRAISIAHQEIIVDSKTGFKLGDSISLGRNTYRVVGLTKKAVSSGGDPMIYLDLSEAQELQFLFSNEQIRNDRFRGGESSATAMVNTFVLKVKKGFDPIAVAQEIKRWKHQEVYTQEEQAAILTTNLIERSAKQIGMFTVILLIVSSVIISLIIYTMTMGKIKEIAILKLIGAPNSVITKMIGQQSLLLGGIAFIGGNIFAHASADIFPKTIVLFYSDAAKLFVIVIIISILASLSGIRSALHVDPASAIGG